MQETFSLYELNEHIRRVIALNFQEGIWVSCEISQARQSRGHYYIEFVQKSDDTDAIVAQSRGVLWAGTGALLRKKYGAVFDDLLQDGVSVRVKVKVDFHERYGLKLLLEDIDPEFTIGNLELKRREVLLELIRLGLVDRNGRLPAPLVAQRIAVLSAQHAAGYHDFRQHLQYNDHGFTFELDLFPVALQGAAVEDEVVEALKEVNRVHKHYDCCVIIRGGGSKIDLGGFDSLDIGKAIANCRIPVFTGIGHEIDTTVADAVAHTSYKTPTAVADALISMNIEFEDSIHYVYDEIAGYIRYRTEAARSRLQNARSLLRILPVSLLTRERINLENIPLHMRQAARSYVKSQRSVLGAADRMIRVLDPVNTLQRGFSITRSATGVVTDPSTLEKDDIVTTQLAKGEFKSKVQ